MLSFPAFLVFCYRDVHNAGGVGCVYDRLPGAEMEREALAYGAC